jgi:hypothetical protein
MNAQIDRQIYGLICRWKEKCTDEWTNRQKNVQMNAQIERETNGQMNVQIDIQMNG